MNAHHTGFNQLMNDAQRNDERTGLLQIYIPRAGAIQAADVSTSNYTAEFGRAAGAVTNVILKSGTNRFPGSAYEYNRVSALAARSFFNHPLNANGSPNPVARSTYNYYGGSVGGPIIKNKTFFFGDILHTSDIRGQFNQVEVPTDAFRSGDVSAGGSPIYNPFTGNPDGTNRSQFVASSAPGVATVPGPNNTTVDAFNPACANPAGCPNIVPVALISPIALKILNLVPHAQSTALSNNLSLNRSEERR